jgi:S1-C subfamily serine protease
LAQPLRGQVTQSPVAAPPTRASGAEQPSPESAVYQLVRRAVFKIQAGAATGSGFLIDSLGGVIVTNQHVVDEAQSDEISVFIDSVTRVPARVVAADHDADLALLRVHPDFLAGRAGLTIARADSSRSVVESGEHVIAVGFPRTQQMSVTAGVVSSVRQGAITSDVRINHGNSGGPLLNLRGEVVGVNTFLEFDPGTAGISGAVSLAPLESLLQRARATSANGQPPAKRLLPRLTSQAFPIAALRQTADTATDMVYERMSNLDVDNFTVSIRTPVSTLVMFTRDESAVWGARRRREREAPVLNREHLRQFAPYRDWEEYVGSETVAAVVIEVVPKVGQTTGTSVANFLGAVAAGLSRTAYVPGTQHMEFKGDVEWVRFYRNGDLIDPVLGGRTPQRVLLSNMFVEMRDVAYRGVYVLRPEVFAPDSLGGPPSVMMVIGDLTHPYTSLAYQLPPDVASRIWNDFLPYYRGSGRGSYRTADPANGFITYDERTFCDSHDCSGGDLIESGPAAGVRVTGWVIEGGGVLVGWVPQPSRATRAGLQSNDVIVRIDGRTPQSVEDVVQMLGQASTLPRVLYRRRNRLGWAAEGSDAILTGVRLDAEGPVANGVGVAEVVPGSAAATAGIRPGDHLVAVDGQVTATVERLDDLMQRNRSGHWRLGVQRGGSLLEIRF